MASLSNTILKRESERLVLETLTPANMSDDYIAWLQDPEILKYLEIRHSKQTREKIITFVQSMLESDDNLLMGIFLQDGKKHIGNIKLGPVHKIYPRADIGIIIGDKNSWGKGYASEAIDTLCRIAFETLGLRRVQAGAYASNGGSIKAFEKVGFKKEGVLKDHWILDGKPEDEILFARLAST